MPVLGCAVYLQLTRVGASRVPALCAAVITLDSSLPVRLPSEATLGGVVSGRNHSGARSRFSDRDSQRCPCAGPPSPLNGVLRRTPVCVRKRCCVAGARAGRWEGGTQKLANRLRQRRQKYLPAPLQPVHPLAESVAAEAGDLDHFHLRVHAPCVGNGSIGVERNVRQ